LVNIMGNILVVDDELDNTKSIKTILEVASHKVSIANSGEKCLELWQSGKPELILLDIMMPGMSGYDVFERIRRVDKETKIVFLTVLFAPKERIQQLMDLGLNGYITKPYGMEELVNAVTKHLDKW